MALVARVQVESHEPVGADWTVVAAVDSTCAPPLVEKVVEVALRLHPAVRFPSPTSSGRVAVAVWSSPLRVSEKLMLPGVVTHPSTLGTVTLWCASALVPPLSLTVWPVKTWVVEVPAESVSVTARPPRGSQP